MSFELPDLPYERNALEPYISAETLDYHHGKHHASYVKKLNKAVVGSDMENQTLEQIIEHATGSLFNNAAQVWNHTFYWNCMRPEGGGEATGGVAKALDAQFGSFEKFRKAFSDSAAANFGSGWTWLVRKSDGSLAVVNTDNAGTPLTDADTHPLLTLDVWEHAYYIDYRNARPDYINAFWQLVNWEFVNQNFSASNQESPDEDQHARRRAIAG
jgi:Fe-Mn family superoxide dismutase